MSKNVAIPIQPVQWFKTKRNYFRAHFGAPNAILVANFQPRNGINIESLMKAVQAVYSKIDNNISYELDSSANPPVIIAKVPGIPDRTKIAALVTTGLDIINRALESARH